MIYEIMNRMDARQASYEPSAPVTAIISITDPGGRKNMFYPQNWIADILELQFMDVEEGGEGCITQRQAREIAKFAQENYKRIERFIIHCEFGQSRSAGVAAAISDYFEGNDGGIFRNRAYAPNITCYKYVLDALERKKLI